MANICVPTFNVKQYILNNTEYMLSQVRPK